MSRSVPSRSAVIFCIFCHAAPGVLTLEDDEGKENRVTTVRFCEEAFQTDRGVPLVVLAGCSTGIEGVKNKKEHLAAVGRRPPGRRIFFIECPGSCRCATKNQTHRGKPSERLYQSVPRKGGVRFRPTGDNPAYFQYYIARVNTAGWYPGHLFPMKQDIKRSRHVRVWIFNFQLWIRERQKTAKRLTWTPMRRTFPRISPCSKGPPWTR